MRYRILLLAVSLLGLQSCQKDISGPNPDDPNNNQVGLKVILSTQEEVNDFAYGNVAVVRNDLIIDQKEDASITDLSPLAGLEEVGGDLKIMNTDLTNLRGLEALKRVDGGVYIGMYEYLDIDTNAVVPVVRKREMGANTHLESAEALQGLEYVGKNLMLQGSGALNELRLPMLQTLGKKITVDTDTLSLEDIVINPIYYETNLGGNLVVLNNANLESVDMPALKIVGNALEVEQNPFLSSLNLPSLEVVGNDVLLTENAMLDQITASALHQVEGNLELNGLRASAVTAMPLDSIGGKLNIISCEQLGHVDFLTQLEYIGGGLKVDNNAALYSIDGLDAFHDYKPGSKLIKPKAEFTQNPQLSDYCPVSNINDDAGINVIIDDADNAVKLAPYFRDCE